MSEKFFNMAIGNALTFFDKADYYLAESNVKYTVSDSIALARIMHEEHKLLCNNEIEEKKRKTK
jgi:hypothetical protein